MADDKVSFESELCWCIAQLQLGLKTQKPDSKQAKEAIKVLKVLSNPNASYIRKRQLMRTTFGDYRQTMESEDKMITKKMAKIKLTAINPSLRSSVFYRKASGTLSGNESDKHSVAEPDISDTHTTRDGLEPVSCIQGRHDTNKPGAISDLQTCNVDRFNFVKSDNAFRFSFSGVNESIKTDTRTVIES